MSNMKVIIESQDDKKLNAIILVENAKLGFFAKPTTLEMEPQSGKLRYPAQIHIDKDATGCNELIALMRKFRTLQGHNPEAEKIVSWCAKDCDIKRSDGKNVNPDTGEVWANVANTWEISSYRQESQGKGLVFIKKSFKQGQSVPAGWAQQNKESIVKHLKSPSEISGGDIVNIEFSLYSPKGKNTGVFAGWNYIQLIKHVGKGGQQLSDFDSLPDSDVEIPEMDFSDFGGVPVADEGDAIPF